MEALERRGKVAALAAIMFILFWSQCKGVEGQKNPNSKMSYVCPPQFIRLGHSCYYFSDKKATWQNALFDCKDRDSNLSIPERWEDRNLRRYLNTSSIERTSRWIGGIYDYGTKSWRWGGELKLMKYQSFSRMKKLSPEQLQWHCIAMMPELLYRWAPQSCIEPRKFICQTKIRKIPKSKVKNLEKRWRNMGKINEIVAPGVSREVSNGGIYNNEVTANPLSNPKSYDLRPLPIRANPKYPRSSIIIRKNTRRYNRPKSRLKRPFPGYSWNRTDPEGSFKYNADILRSGKTGLTPQQVKSQLARLLHMKNKHLANLKQRNHRNRGDWLVNDSPSNDIPKHDLPVVHGKSYTVKNTGNGNTLFPKMIVEELEIVPPPSVRITRNNKRAVG